MVLDHVDSSGRFVISLEQAVHIGGDSGDKGGKIVVVTQLHSIFRPNNSDKIRMYLAHPPQSDEVEMADCHRVSVSGNSDVVHHRTSSSKVLAGVATQTFIKLPVGFSGLHRKRFKLEESFLSWIHVVVLRNCIKSIL